MAREGVPYRRLCVIVRHREGTDLAGSVREVWDTLVSFGGRISMTTRYAVEQGDLALLSNIWTFELGGAEAATAITSEVARRQADDSWRYVIDNPYAART
ncbi:MAG TPA: hypothetical protein VFZ64_06165 [Nocardioidaceae bacterium]